jgi:hypothetical protein
MRGVSQAKASATCTGFSLCMLLFFALPLSAHDPITTQLTWTRDISRIVNRRCIGCHSAGASVPLATYDTARPWAKAMRDEVMTRKMPPWGAVPGYGPELRGDPSLAQTEIDTVVRWVEGGAPKGDDVWLPRATPKRPEARPVLAGPFIEVTSDWRASRDFRLAGIRGEGRELQVILARPNGAVEPILWVRDNPGKIADFVFTEPVAIDRGSILHVRGSAALKIIRAAESPRPPGITTPK